MESEDGKNAVLADQIKCQDWRIRKAAFKAKAPRQTVIRVVNLIGALLTK